MRPDRDESSGLGADIGQMIAHRALFRVRPDTPPTSTAREPVHDDPDVACSWRS